MATTFLQLEGDHPGAPSPLASADPRSAARASAGVRTRRTGERLLLAWAAVVGSMIVLEPAPNDPAAPPLWASLLGVAFVAAFGATVAGLAARRPWGLRASATAAALGLLVAGACAATSHHPTFWWGYELVGFGVLAALTAGALRPLAEVRPRAHP